MVFNAKNLNKFLEKFSNIEFIKLQDSPKEHALQCILNKDINKQKDKQKDNLDIVSTIKQLDKLFEYWVNIKGNNLANIYSSGCNINKYYIYELAELVNALTYRNLAERYEYIYDLICEKLEYDINKYGYCLFEDNKCIAQRDSQKWPENEYNGCCYDINKREECSHLSCKQCDTKCISCRSFTFKYLKDRGIGYNIHKNVHARCFLNMLQRPELVWNFFMNKEDILKKVPPYSMPNGRMLK